MTSKVGDYLDTMERLFLLSLVVMSFQVREREERFQEGFIRIRAVLTNENILEAFEFVVGIHEEIQIKTYRIHWQSEVGELKRRCDNASHHQDISTFPHHVHYGSEEEVKPSEPMTICKALAGISEELKQEEQLPQP